MVYYQLFGTIIWLYSYSIVIIGYTTKFCCHKIISEIILFITFDIMIWLEIIWPFMAAELVNIGELIVNYNMS